VEENFRFGCIYFGRRSPEFLFVKVSMSRRLRDFPTDGVGGCIEIGMALPGFEITQRPFKVSLN